MLFFFLWPRPFDSGDVERERADNVVLRSMACAVREAYAATLTVVILIDGQRRGNDGDE